MYTIDLNLSVASNISHVLSHVLLTLLFLSRPPFTPDSLQQQQPMRFTSTLSSTPASFSSVSPSKSSCRSLSSVESSGVRSTYFWVHIRGGCQWWYNSKLETSYRGIRERNGHDTYQPRHDHSGALVLQPHGLRVTCICLHHKLLNQIEHGAYQEEPKYTLVRLPV